MLFVASSFTYGSFQRYVRLYYYFNRTTLRSNVLCNAYDAFSSMTKPWAKRRRYFCSCGTSFCAAHLVIDILFRVSQ